MPNSIPASWAARNGDSVNTPPKSKRTASMGVKDEPSVVTVSTRSRGPIVRAPVRFQLLVEPLAVVVGEWAVPAGAALGPPPHLVGRTPTLLLQRSLQHLVGARERHLVGDPHEP